ncbi:MAG: hypothetical protein Fur0037_28980 [Planctomycetota bacterium]
MIRTIPHQAAGGSADSAVFGGLPARPGRRLPPLRFPHMDWKLFSTVFGSVFLAEIGDKTQIATMLFAAKAGGSQWSVFTGAAAALVATSAVGVAAGSALSSWIGAQALRWIAGLCFIAVGIWTLLPR